jgi:hypothetical protein
MPSSCATWSKCNNVETGVYHLMLKVLEGGGEPKWVENWLVIESLKLESFALILSQLCLLVLSSPMPAQDDFKLSILFWIFNLMNWRRLISHCSDLSVGNILHFCTVTIEPRQFFLEFWPSSVLTPSSPYSSIWSTYISLRQCYPLCPQSSIFFASCPLFHIFRF